MSDPRVLPAVITTIHMLKPNLDVYYPSVEGLKNLAFQHKLNKTIVDLVNDIIKRLGYFENPKTEVTGTYEIENNEKGVLSLSIIIYAFSGGAHGFTIVESLTADIQQGAFYELRDLFKPGSDYVKRISDIVSRQIRERNIPLLNEFKSIRPDQDFYVADKTLVIYFELYEITPYYYGFPAFPIILYDIEDIINPEGPLSKLLSSF